MIDSIPYYLQQKLLREALRNIVREEEKRYDSPLELADPIHWITHHFFIPETKSPIVLYPHQLASLREALRKDANGNFIYSTIVWSDIKKSAKSTIAAAVGLWRALSSDYATVRVIANDLKQADSRVAYYMRRAVQLNDQMKHEIKTRYTSLILPNHSTIEAVPIDPKGEAGGGDEAVIFSELWGAESNAAKQMWSETTLSPLKFGQSFRWVETYAGYSGEAETLEMLYMQGVKEGKHIGEEIGLADLAAYRNEAARLYCMWNDTPRLRWQTPEYYAQESSALTENEFLRLHRNKWVSSVSVFVPAEWWAGCRSSTEIVLDDRIPVVLAADAGVSNDCFGIVGMTKHPDNELLSRVVYSRKWVPPRGGKIDFDEPEKELTRLHERYNIIEVAYDPYQLHSLMTRLRKDEGINTREFNQGAERAIADKALHDAIRDRTILHNNDLDLNEHVANANAKTEGEKLRIIKRAEHLKIDLCVAMSMCRQRLYQLNV